LGGGASSRSATTRPVAASQVTPSHAPQQSPPAHVARMPVVSTATPALKPSSAARSAGEHGGDGLSSPPRAEPMTPDESAWWPAQRGSRAARRMATTRRSLAEICIVLVADGAVEHYCTSAGDDVIDV